MTLPCTRCNADLQPLPSTDDGTWQRCTACGSHVLIHTFRALLQPSARPDTDETDMVGTCYIHPDDDAVAACTHCGLIKRNVNSRNDRVAHDRRFEIDVDKALQLVGPEAKDYKPGTANRRQ